VRKNRSMPMTRGLAYLAQSEKRRDERCQVVIVRQKGRRRNPWNSTSTLAQTEITWWK